MAGALDDLSDIKADYQKRMFDFGRPFVRGGVLYMLIQHLGRKENLCLAAEIKERDPHPTFVMRFPSEEELRQGAEKIKKAEDEAA